MDTMSAQTWIIIAGVLVVAVIALSAWLFFQKKQSHRLQQRFGAEYGRTVDQLGSRTRAESELKARQQRVASLTILPLSPSDAARFTEAWVGLQSRFVDNPKGVMLQADQLVRELMAKRGYPVGDFEHRAADISVDYPNVVDHYRAAQAIALRNERGEADTEELRKAVVHYRALFDELLEISAIQPEGTPSPRTEAHA